MTPTKAELARLSLIHTSQTTDEKRRPTSDVESGDDQQSNKELMKSLRRNIKKREREYVEAVAASRPVFDVSHELPEYSASAEETGKAMAMVALRAVSLQTAVQYANAMITQDARIDGLDIDQSEIKVLMRKLFRLEMTSIIADHFKVPGPEREVIINNLIMRDFPQARVTSATNTGALAVHPAGGANAGAPPPPSLPLPSPTNAPMSNSRSNEIKELKSWLMGTMGVNPREIKAK